MGPHITLRWLRTRPGFSPRSRLSPQEPSNATTPEHTPPPTSPPFPAPLEGLTRHAYRWETATPSSGQLARADSFFLRYSPSLLWTQEKFKKIELGDAPEVVFLGRSNVGKSSLLNALLNVKNLAYTSNKPGKTRLMNAYSVHQGKILLVDVPGYGYASREDWGVQIMKYLKSRRQLRRTFVLIDASHGPKSTDMQLLDAIGKNGIPYQIILSKIDRLNQHDGSLAKAFEETRYLMKTGIGGVTGLGELLGVAADPAKKGPKLGISDLRWSVMVACGLV